MNASRFPIARLVVSLVAALLVLAVAPARPARAALRIVTTTADLADFARAIGGSRVHVTAICHGAQDPHYVRARPSYMVALSRADLLLAVGLDLEVGWLPALITGARNPRIQPSESSPPNPGGGGSRGGYLEAASAITPIDVPSAPVDRSHGDVHPRGNPHFWLDPHNAKRAVRIIAQRLTALDPKGSALYRDSLRAFEARLDRAIARWTRTMAPYRGTKIVSYHRTFNYFHARFGLDAVGTIEERPGIPPSPAHLARLTRQIKVARVGVIFHESYHDRSASDLVAKRTAATVLTLPTSVGGMPGIDHYEQLIDRIVGAFVEAVGRGAVPPASQGKPRE